MLENWVAIGLDLKNLLTFLHQTIIYICIHLPFSKC